MFISEKDKIGSCYFEFQFHKSKNPVNFNEITHWKNDSLLLHDENFTDFYNRYGFLLNQALLPNGSQGFDPCGINYYNRQAAETILSESQKITEKQYSRFMPWLEEAVHKYNGFCILGI